MTDCRACPIYQQCNNVYDRVSDWARDGSLEILQPSQRQASSAALGVVASKMMEVIDAVDECSGPSYGRVASWLIRRARWAGDYPLARQYEVQFAKCSSPDVYYGHYELRRASSQRPGL